MTNDECCGRVKPSGDPRDRIASAHNDQYANWYPEIGPTPSWSKYPEAKDEFCPRPALWRSAEATAVVRGHGLRASFHVMSCLINCTLTTRNRTEQSVEPFGRDQEETARDTNEKEKEQPIRGAGVAATARPSGTSRASTAPTGHGEAFLQRILSCSFPVFFLHIFLSLKLSRQDSFGRHTRRCDEAEFLVYPVPISDLRPVLDER